MKIIHVASEFTPLAKAGGMGDVLLGLARATVKMGHDVTVILPKYDCLNIPCSKLEDLFITYENKKAKNTLWSANFEGIPLILVEPKTEHSFFQRGHIYGQPDEADRYAYFSKTVAAYLESKPAPDVIHLHDWHTALVPFLYQNCPTILTIHNLAYPGSCGYSTFEKLGLSPDEVVSFQHEDHYSLLRGGLIAASRITAVSPTYAKEILTPQFGGSFCALLNKHRQKLVGILNGIDYTFWNPTTDPFLPTHYNFNSIEEKAIAKRVLQKRLGLPIENKLLVSAIARLVPQKGPDLIEAAFRRTLEKNGQCVLLGAASDPKTKEQFLNFKKEMAKEPNLQMELIYNEALSHQVFAASDVVLIPSLFEPCGLTQMIALHYGTLPLVRKTGGLADTIFEGKNGFVFESAEKKEIISAIDRCFSCWKNTPDKWRALIKTGMEEDFSWDQPAKAYLNLYTESESMTKISR